MTRSALTRRTMTLPFSIPEMAGGLAEAHGLATLTPEGLKLEWETSETLFGSKMSKGNVLIPIESIADATFKRSWYFWYELQVQCTSLEYVSAVPGSKQGRLKLNIDRANVEQARRFVVMLNQFITEDDIHLLDDELRQLRDTEFGQLERPVE